MDTTQTPHLKNLISHSTTMITAYNLGSNQGSIGTGFFYNFEKEINGEKKIFPTIITNKHVLEGYTHARITLTTCSMDSELQHTGLIEDEKHEVFDFEIKPITIFHPSDDVDLAAIYFNRIVNLRADRKFRAFALTSNYLVPEHEKSSVTPIENVLMIGYPSGISDETNNRPVFRRGITATHPFVKLNGRSHFLVDIATFGGSSGSPIFQFEDGNFSAGNNSMSFGTRIRLIGIQYCGHTITAEGKIEEVTAIDMVKLASKTNLFINLSLAIHAEKINDFLPLLSDQISFPLKIFPKNDYKVNYSF